MAFIGSCLSRWPIYKHWWGLKGSEMYHYKWFDPGHGMQQGPDCPGRQVAQPCCVLLFC